MTIFLAEKVDSEIPITPLNPISPKAETTHSFHLVYRLGNNLHQHWTWKYVLCHARKLSKKSTSHDCTQKTPPSVPIHCPLYFDDRAHLSNFSYHDEERLDQEKWNVASTRDLGLELSRKYFQHEIKKNTRSIWYWNELHSYRKKKSYHNLRKKKKKKCTSFHSFQYYCNNSINKFFSFFFFALLQFFPSYFPPYLFVEYAFCSLHNPPSPSF